jgi:hypothetical protein
MVLPPLVVFGVIVDRSVQHFQGANNGHDATTLLSRLNDLQADYDDSRIGRRGLVKPSSLCFASLWS